MSNATTQNQAETQTKGQKPSHLVYHVTDFGQEKSKWDQVGAAWEHQDGEGFNVHLKSFPVDGRLTIRRRKDKKEENQD